MDTRFSEGKRQMVLCVVGLFVAFAGGFLLAALVRVSEAGNVQATDGQGTQAGAGNKKIVIY